MSWANAHRKMTLTRSTPRRTRVSPSLAYRQNLLSSVKTTERHSTFQSTLSQHQSSHAWWCRGVSGSLARGTRDMSPPASRQFPIVLDDTAGATCAWISSLDQGDQIGRYTVSPFGLRKTEFCDIYLMKCDYRHLGDICLETRDILAI